MCKFLDLDELEKDLKRLVEKEDLYWTRNEAKFRACRQGATYEEFDAIVKGSHLVPIKRKELSRLSEEKRVVWNSKTCKNYQCNEVNFEDGKNRMLKFEDSPSYENLETSQLTKIFKSENYSTEYLQTIFFKGIDDPFFRKSGIRLSFGRRRSEDPTNGNTVFKADIEQIWKIVLSVFKSKRLKTHFGFIGERDAKRIEALVINVKDYLDIPSDDIRVQRILSHFAD